jgi:tryptophanyl-tRNA synthetase
MGYNCTEGLTNPARYLFSEKRTVEEVQGYCTSNSKDIIAIGFDPAKTFIFSDVSSMQN